MNATRTISLCLLALAVSGASLAEEAAKPQAKVHHGVGVVKKVDADAGKVTLQHEAIDSVGWPSMTMPFAVRDKAVLARLKAGQKVEFDFVQEGSKPVIQAIR